MNSVIRHLNLKESKMSDQKGGAVYEENDRAEHDARNSSYIDQTADAIEKQGADQWITDEIKQVAENLANNSCDVQGNQA